MRRSYKLPVLKNGGTEQQQRILEGISVWASYYRANINRFAKDYLHLTLKPFQAILLQMMNISVTFVFIACRGIGKTWLCAVFCCIRAILYPGSKIVIAAGTRGQGITVLEKILTELRPKSPELSAEIDDAGTSINMADAIIKFKNTSYIKAVTPRDSARGNRAHVLIMDEFRMLRKDMIEKVLSKFLSAPRIPGFRDLPEYKDDPQYEEPNMKMYLSSAWYKDHWSYTRCTDSCRFMLDETKQNFVCGFPYQLALKEGLLMRDAVLEQMLESDFNEMSWAMEMNAEFVGAGADAFFNFNTITNCRVLEYPMLPGKLAGKLPASNKMRIAPKLPGEIRLLSADIALMATTSTKKNDATAIFVNRLIPTRGKRYTSNIVYSESNEGWHTEDEALNLRQLFDEFECDYLVLDTRNVGLSIYDLLSREMTDPETGEIYPALSCCNNKDLAARCNAPGAQKAIWSIQGSAKLNADAAVLLREGFRNGRIHLLMSESDVADKMEDIKGFKGLSSFDKAAVMMPYINTTLLVGELVNLKHDMSGQNLRITEKQNARKDRYSSLSYNYYVAVQLEREMRNKVSGADESVSDVFMYRKPKHFNKRGR